MKKNKIASFFMRWEWFLVALMIVICIVFNAKDAANLASGAAKKDVFNFANVIKSLRPYMLYSFMTMGTMLILAMAEIDISCGALAALSVVVLGVVYDALTKGGMANGTAFVIAIASCIIVGGLGGALNGFLVTTFHDLFSMIITLATQLFFRGLSYLLIGGQTLTFKDDTFSSLKNLNALLDIGEYKIPLIVIIFLVVALGFWFVVHQTTLGRKIFAIGTNATAAKFSGVRVNRIKFWCFVILGVTSAVTGIFFIGATSSSVKADIMDGYHMYAIAAAVLGGFSTDGGKGSVIGAVISLFIFGIVKIGLATLFGFADSSVNMSVGIILILSVLGPNMVEDIGKKMRVHAQRVETAKANAAKA